MKVATINPIDLRANKRRTPDNIWPLRAADGRTWAEKKEVENDRR